MSGAIKVIHTPTTDVSWDAGVNVKNLKSGDEAYFRQMFAWEDPAGDPATKEAYKFPHHEVDGDGNIGAANVKACQSVIAVLNGARGGADIPNGDRQGVWNHVAAHLKDAKLEPAELKSADSNVERRVVPLSELRVAGEADAPKIDGHAAVFNSRSEQLPFIEIIEPGFFENVLEDDTRALFNHDMNIVLGRTKSKTLSIEEDKVGLHFVCDPPKTQLVNDMVLEPMRRGDVDQCSFSFLVAPGGDEWHTEGETIMRTLKKGGCARLFDVSPVTFPAYPETSATVRSKFSELQQQASLDLVQADLVEIETARAEARVRLANHRRYLDLADLF